jgi:hypothetical protein
MKSVKNACQLQPSALDINVGDQIEQLDQVIRDTDTRAYFDKTFITGGMKELLSRGMARLAGKSNDAIFHLKQAMGGGKTHLIVGFGLLAKSPEDRAALIGDIPHQAAFTTAKIAAFNGRNRPAGFFWGEIAKQLGNPEIFPSSLDPDENDWVRLFEGDEPILILLDELPPYFHYYSTQASGMGTVADRVTSVFSCLLTAAQKKKNVCVVVSDLDAAYDTGGKLIQRALDDATQEIGRAEVNITPVNLESNEIYEILRKRLFVSLPDRSEIAEVAAVYGERLAEAAKAKSIERSAEAIATQIEETYPFHPSFKSLVALFKENEKFKQTRGLMELVSRLLKSVWQSKDDVYLIGAQHFDTSIPDVMEKLAEISEMRDVMARDLWASSGDAHAQLLDLNKGNSCATKTATLLLASSLSTAVNAVKGLTEPELIQCLIDPTHKASDFKSALADLQNNAWYLHKTTEGRHYFDHAENLTKKLQSYADKAPQNKVDELIRSRLCEMYAPMTKEAFEKVLALPEMDEAEAVLKTSRALLIINPDGKAPPEVVSRFFQGLINKNSLLVLTGDKSSMASVDKAARHVYAAAKADAELPASHPQRPDLEDKKTQYSTDFQSTVLNVFDKLLFPGRQGSDDVLRSKALDTTYPSGEPYNGERQVVKTLTADPIKLYTEIPANFDALRARAETLLFGGNDEARRADLIDKMRQSTAMPWLPPKGFDQLAQEACKRGAWEDLGNGYLTKKPKPKTTSVLVIEETSPDDTGTVRLKVESQNAGPAPRIHFQEENAATESSPVLSENTLTTSALRVQFLAIDPSGACQTGSPVTWTNKLTLRSKLDETKRTVELFVAPRGTIRYTLDGSEARSGQTYSAPIPIGDKAATIHVFAECEGIEEKRSFQFQARGSNEICIIREDPAELVSPTPKKLDNSSKAYEGLRIAKERGIRFENVILTLGTAPRVVHLSLGDFEVDSEFIEKTLSHLQALLPPDAPLIMQFKKVHCPTGHDLEQFANSLGIQLVNSEIVQK